MKENGRWLRSGVLSSCISTRGIEDAYVRYNGFALYSDRVYPWERAKEIYRSREELVEVDIARYQRREVVTRNLSRLLSKIGRAGFFIKKIVKMV